MSDGARVLVVFLILLGVAGLAFWLYDAWYRKRINRALEEDRPAGPVPEPRRAGKVILILAAAACVLGFLIWANRLQTRIAELENSIRNDMWSLSQRVDSNYQNLIDELRAENAVFSAFDYEISGTDAERRMLSVKVTAMPKEAAEDAAVFLRFGDRALALKKGPNGGWSGQAELPFREALQTESASLSIVEEGRERNQEVDFALPGWKWAHFPKVVGTADYVSLDAATPGRLGLTADVGFTVTPVEWIRTFSAVVQLDGKDVLEQDLQGSLQKKNGDYAEDSVRLEGQFDAREDSVMTLLLRFTDDLGFLHEYTLVTYPDGIRGDPRGEQSESVYDTDGTLLLTNP
jgi:hypothetical protein